MSTINANSSGIVFTGNTDGTLDLATGGTTRVTVTSGGNLNFAGTGQRITGDMSNATVGSRLSFQNSVTNGQTIIGVLPNGSSTTSGISFEGDSATTNGTIFQMLNNAAGAGDARFNAGIRGTGTYLPITFYTGGSERVRIDTSGNVGIGIATPLQRFNAVNTSITGGAPATSGSAADPNAVARFQAGSVAMDVGVYAAGQMWIQPRSFTNYATNYDLVLQPNGGNVGIGTATPGAKLDISNGQFRLSTAYQVQWFNGATQLGSILCDSGPNLTFQTGSSNTERMRIDSSGNVGIGTASPTDSSGFGRCIDMQSTTGAALYLRDSDATSTYGYFAYEGGGTRACYFGAIGADTIIRFITAGSERGRVTAAGEWLIGGTTDNGAYNLQCNGTGVWGAGAYVNGSDVRLKDNITTLNDGLNVINQLRPVTFKYKPGYSKDQSTQPGFIAQELQAILAGKDYVDGVVQAGPKHLNVAYQTLIPILVKSIQELAAKVAALEGN